MPGSILLNRPWGCPIYNEGLYIERSLKLEADMARFDDQVAIITGGGGDIASALALRLGAEGARILVVEYHRERGEAIVDRLGREGVDARLVVGDVAEPDTADQAVAEALDGWGRIDMLVNNALAPGTYANLWELPADDFDQPYRTNMRAAFLFTRAVVPPMMERDYGRIVNIASIAGKEGNEKMSAYSATKAGLIGMTKSVGKELAKTGIRVNCVTPAMMMTRPMREADPDAVAYMVGKIPMGRPAKVEETVAMVVWLLSAECSFSTGAVFDVSGGRATY